MNKEELYQYRVENHKPLKFGTAGLRDYDSRLSDMQIYICTKGFLNYLLLNGFAEKGSNVAIAGDFRPSTPRILFAVAAGIIDSGFYVIYNGEIPTPTIALYGFSNRIPSIMVTASHNPYGQNGVKFIKPDNEVMKEEEKDILDEISKIRNEEYRKELEDSMFELDGSFKNFDELKPAEQFLYYLTKKSLKKEDKNAHRLYVERYKKAFGKALLGEKIVFYEQTSVGREIIPEILEELGAEVIRLGRIDETKEFVSVDTEDMKPALLDRMADFARENKCEICLSADGDADRPALVFLRDKASSEQSSENKASSEQSSENKASSEQSSENKASSEQSSENSKFDYEFLKGDKLNVIATLLLKPDFVAVPIHVNNRAHKVMLGNGVEVGITKVGSPPVIRALIDKQKNSDRKLKLYGFECNGGGIAVSSFEIKNYGFLSALPTRDPILPVVCAMILARDRKMNFSKMVSGVFSGDKYSHCHTALVENLDSNRVTKGCERYSPEVGIKIIDEIRPLDKYIVEVDFQELIFRNEKGEKLEPEREVVEHSFKIKNSLMPYLLEIFERDIKIKKINFLDGIKIFLVNDEVVHFRPSRNASQFRIYLESPDEQRAFRLVEKAIKPSSGTLVKFINDFIDNKIII